MDCVVQCKICTFSHYSCEGVCESLCTNWGNHSEGCNGISPDVRWCFCFQKLNQASVAVQVRWLEAASGSHPGAWTEGGTGHMCIPGGLEVALVAVTVPGLPSPHCHAGYGLNQAISLPATEMLLSLLGGQTALHMRLYLTVVTNPLTSYSLDVNTPEPLHLVPATFYFPVPMGSRSVVVPCLQTSLARFVQGG